MYFRQKSGMIFYQSISPGGIHLDTKTTRIAPEEIARQRDAQRRQLADARRAAEGAAAVVSCR